jgi:hypothetical protein
MSHTRVPDRSERWRTVASRAGFAIVSVITLGLSSSFRSCCAELGQHVAHVSVSFLEAERKGASANATLAPGHSHFEWIFPADDPIVVRPGDRVRVRGQVIAPPRPGPLGARIDAALVDAQGRQLKSVHGATDEHNLWSMDIDVPADVEPASALTLELNERNYTGAALRRSIVVARPASDSRRTR